MSTQTPADMSADPHVSASFELRRKIAAEAARIAQREGGAPWPFERQRRAAQNALLLLGWDTTAARVLDPEEDAYIDGVVAGLSLSATRDTNSPAYRDRARAAVREVMALAELIASQPRGRKPPAAARVTRARPA